MASIERILQFISYKGISKREFYTTVELSNGYLDKTKTINSDILERITYKYPELNMIWVITGKGDMLINEDKPEGAPISNNHAHDPEATANTNASAFASKSTIRTEVKPTPSTAILNPKIITVDNQGKENILHVSVKAAAGYLAGHSDLEYFEKLPSFNLPGLTGSTYRSFEVDGDSMYPTLKHGQMVIGEWVETLDDIKEDRVYIVVTKNDRPVIKRLLNRIKTRGVIIAKSDATNDRELYKNYTIRPEDIVELWYARFHGGFDFQAPSDMWKRVNNHESDITVLQNTVGKLMTVIKSAGLINE
jgi:phage repressor protein C with HTH and peptisase S24 domain